MSSVPEGRPIVRGEHVYLRAPERADIPLFVRWFNDAEVLHNLAMFAPMSEAAESAWFDRMLSAQGRTDYHFGEHHDVHLMGLLRDEWLALPHTRSWDRG